LTERQSMTHDIERPDILLCIEGLFWMILPPWSKT
jgi:hypothetical protein